MFDHAFRIKKYRITPQEIKPATNKPVSLRLVAVEPILFGKALRPSHRSTMRRSQRRKASIMQRSSLLIRTVFNAQKSTGELQKNYLLNNLCLHFLPAKCHTVIMHQKYIRYQNMAPITQCPQKLPYDLLGNSR